MTDIPVVPVGRVARCFIDRVEKKSETKFVSLGKFDLMFLCDMVDLLEEDTSGEIELKVILPADNRAGAALLIAQYDGENYIALAGIRTHPIDIEKVDGVIIPKVLREE